MYFFYCDESASRDPSAGTAENRKDHIYVLLAVGMFERQWRPFEPEVSGLQPALVNRLQQDGVGPFDLADCEVKSNWIRNPSARAKDSAFLNALDKDDVDNIASAYFRQVSTRNVVTLASVIDKRYLRDGTSSATMHQKAYEFLLERVQHYMMQYHPQAPGSHHYGRHMDDTSQQFNRSVVLRHASFQRSGNSCHRSRESWNPDFCR